MAIYVKFPGTELAREPHQQSITHRASGTTVTFDSPADFLYYVARRPDVKDEVRAGKWSWVGCLT